MVLRVFVYGTLKPGEENYQNYCAEKIISTERAFTFGTLYDLPAGYPGMTSGNNPVYGYIYEFSDISVLNHLDELEDFDASAPPENNLYNRQKIEIFCYQGERYAQGFPLNSLGDAWVYLMNSQQVKQMNGKLLTDGWWSGRNLTWW